MNCQEISDLLQDYVMRELSPDERRRVDEHLLECEGCRKELALMSAIVLSLDSQPMVEPSAEFSQRVIANLPKQQSFVPSPLCALILIPVLSGLVYLFRVQLAEVLSGVFERFEVGIAALSRVQVPNLSSINMGQLVIVPVVLASLGLVLAFSAVAFCWRYYAET